MFAVQIFLVITGSSICAGRRDMAVKAFPKDDGYRGIWFTLGQFSEYGDKYSGGLGTYTAKHVPLAVYSKEANKTFLRRR